MKYNKAFTLSYDDGVEQDRRLVAILNRYNIKAAFNLNTGIQRGSDSFEINGVRIRRMEQEGLDALYSGHEIALHGLTHAPVAELDEDGYDMEFLADAKNIERLYGKFPEGMAYAYGEYSEKAAIYLKGIGIRYGRTTEASHNFDMPPDPLFLKPTCHHNDETLFELAKKFIDAKPKGDEKMLFYVWGHSYEFDVNGNWERIEELCAMLGNRSGVFYGTNARCLLGEWED